MKTASCYVNEFRPLAQTSAGRKAIDQHKLPPFIDASCRREPDLESAFPSITAICRGEYFAPLLRENDVVAYMTKDFVYPPNAASVRRLVAVLRVRESWLKHRPKRGLETHAKAAEWYQQQKLAIPSNCMVSDKGRKPLDQTDRYAIERKIATTLEEWDDGYRLRAIECGAFHACEKIFCEVNDPPQFTTEQLSRWFGLPPNPRDPQSLASEKFILMLEWLCEQPAATTSHQRLQSLIKSLRHA